MTRALALALAIAVLGCAGRPSTRASTTAAASPTAAREASTAPVSWSDALVDANRDVVLRIAPRELARDPVFGGIVQRAVDAAFEHARTRGASSATLAVFTRAEDVVVAVRDREGRDSVAIVTGVPQGTAPNDLVDEAGRPLFSAMPALAGNRVRVYGGTALEERARIFELPGSTWVIGVGRGAERAEEALGRAELLAYAPKLHAPASLSFAGELLATLKARAGEGLRPVARGLTSATMTLSHDPESEARARIRLELAYGDARYAESAEPIAARAAELLVTRLDFPVKPRVARDGSRVAIELAIEAKRD